MELYALQIRKSDLALLTLLNNGVTPQVEKQKTFLVFDATWNSDIPNRIVTERELSRDFPTIKTHGPFLVKFNKK